MTSSMTTKKSMTVFPAFPRDPSTVPNARQKKIIPRVFVPDLGIRVDILCMFVEKIVYFNG